MSDSQHTHLSLTNPIHSALQFILEHYHEARERDQRLDTRACSLNHLRSSEQREPLPRSGGDSLAAIYSAVSGTGP